MKTEPGYEKESSHRNFKLSNMDKLAANQILSEMQKKIAKKDEDLKKMQQIFQALNFYNCFTKQQSHFAQYISDMKILEDENERLREREANYIKAMISSSQAQSNSKKNIAIRRSSLPKHVIKPNNIEPIAQPQSPLEILGNHIKTLSSTISSIQSLLESTEFLTTTIHYNPEEDPEKLLKMANAEDNPVVEENSEECSNSNSDVSIESSDDDDTKIKKLRSNILFLLIF